MERFVDIQLVMHSKAGRLLNSLKEKMIRQIDEAELDPVSRYDLHTRVESMPRRTNLCHGDYNPSNVIITPADTAFIIDWSHATQGDPAVDAARTYLLFHLNGQPQAAATYLDIFGHKSGIGRQEVERWLPAVAACQTLKGDKAQRDLLMRWVNVVDFE
jgi:aminoglycoside phosphotransferase (APT) family kinase protein